KGAVLRHIRAWKRVIPEVREDLRLRGLRPSDRPHVERGTRYVASALILRELRGFVRWGGIQFQELVGRFAVALPRLTLEVLCRCRRLRTRASLIGVGAGNGRYIVLFALSEDLVDCRRQGIAVYDDAKAEVAAAAATTRCSGRSRNRGHDVLPRPGAEIR